MTQKICFQSHYEDINDPVATVCCDLLAIAWPHAPNDFLMAQLMADTALYTSLLPDKAMVRSLLVNRYLVRPCSSCNGPPMTHAIKVLNGVEQLDCEQPENVMFAPMCDTCFSEMCDSRQCLRCEAPLVAPNAPPQDHVIVQDECMMLGEYLCKQCATMLADEPRCYSCRRWAAMVGGTSLWPVCSDSGIVTDRVCTGCSHHRYRPLDLCDEPGCYNMFSRRAGPEDPDGVRRCPACQSWVPKKK